MRASVQRASPTPALPPPPPSRSAPPTRPIQGAARARAAARPPPAACCPSWGTSARAREAGPGRAAARGGCTSTRGSDAGAPGSAAGPPRPPRSRASGSRTGTDTAAHRHSHVAAISTTLGNRKELGGGEHAPGRGRPRRRPRAASGSARRGGRAWGARWAGACAASAIFAHLACPRRPSAVVIAIATSSPRGAHVHSRR